MITAAELHELIAIKFNIMNNSYLRHAKIIMQ